jgi:hypothetical protein
MFTKEIDAGEPLGGSLHTRLDFPIRGRELQGSDGQTRMTQHHRKKATKIRPRVVLSSAFSLTSPA